MAAKLQAESTLTERYQTTVPEPVRKFLRLGKRDKIQYTIRADGDVVIARASSDAADPVVLGFLDFLEADLVKHPERVRGLDARLVKRLKKLAGRVAIDLDAPLSPDDE